MVWIWKKLKNRFPFKIPNEACIGYFGIRDIGLFLRDTGIVVFFILGYWIFSNFGIWDIGFYFWIRVKIILEYGIVWAVYFGIWDIAYPPNQASLMSASQTAYGIMIIDKPDLLYCFETHL